MSTYSMAEGGNGVIAAWETAGKVYTGTGLATSPTISSPAAVPTGAQKHPFVASAMNGQTLLAWTEGTGWQHGGALVWQLTDRNGTAIANGRKPDAIPVWGLPTAYSRPDGTFVVIY